MINLLMPGGKVLFTYSKKKIKDALKKGAKKITKKEAEKITKMGKFTPSSPTRGTVGRFLQKDEKVMQVPMASKLQMRKIRKSISESVKDFMSKKMKKKSGGVVDTGDFGSEAANVANLEMGNAVIGYTGGDDNNSSPTNQAKVTTGDSSDSATTSALNTIGKAVFDVSGMGYAYKGAKKLAEKFQGVRTKQKKATADARLKGNKIFTYNKKNTYNPPTPSDSGDPPKILKLKPLNVKEPIKPRGDRPKENFFPFRAYKDGGGVKSGPPPKSGPNPQVPPVKMRKGKMTKAYKFSCPSRPDGIRGMGAAMRGHKFTGVK